MDLENNKEFDVDREEERRRKQWQGGALSCDWESPHHIEIGS